MATPHIIDGEFQSDKYPTCPRGKVPLSVKDPTAQDLLWQYAQRRRSVDAEFAADLESCLRAAGYETPAESVAGSAQSKDRIVTWHNNGRGPRVVLELHGEGHVLKAERARLLRDELTRALVECGIESAGVSDDTRKVIQTIIDHKDRTGAWLEATALRTLLSIADRSTASPPSDVGSCTNLSPPWFSGRWRDWHRGHGCDKDDGKQRTPDGEAEITAGDRHRSKEAP